MRRLLGGWLAALALLAAAGCGSADTGADDDARPAPPAIVVPTLAVAARAPAPAVDELTVLLTAADGIDAPGLDALASVLSTRPGVRLVVVAPATRSSTGAETGGAAAVIDGQTLNGHPAQVLNTAVADVVVAGLDELAADADLVVIGADEGAAVGAAATASPGVGAARAAVGRGVPSLVLTLGDDHGLDLAAATLALGAVLDFELDRLLDRPTITVVAVPSCAAGTVRGPVRVDAAPALPAPAPDCTGPDGTHETDVDAYGAGYATVAELPDQAMP